MRRHPALVLALLLMPLSACGGSDGGTSAGAGPSSGLPKEEFVRQAEAMCTSLTTDLEAIEAKTSETDAQAGLASLDELVARLDTGVTDLGRLAEAQPDKAELDRILLDPARAQVTAAKAYVVELRAAVAKGPEAAQALPDPVEPTPAVDGAAIRGYGLATCAELLETA